MDVTIGLIFLLIIMGAALTYSIVICRRVKEKLAESQRSMGVLQEKYMNAQYNYSVEQVNELIDRYENEIQKMGADIHDDLIQKLAVYRLYINKLERADDVTTVHVLTRQMKDDFENVIRSVRKISKRLMPEQEIGSFVSMAQELCKRMEAPGVVFIHFESHGNEVPIRYDHRQHLLRIVQESITNVTKHTPAWHVYVRLFFNEQMMTLEIEDDGKSFEILINKIEDRNALTTLRMRINKIGADIQFKKGVMGTVACVMYPYQSVESDNSISESVGD